MEWRAQVNEHGRVERMSNERMPKQVMNVRLEGKIHAT